MSWVHKGRECLPRATLLINDILGSSSITIMFADMLDGNLEGCTEVLLEHIRVSIGFLE